MQTPASVAKTIRSAARARNILTVLMKYGFEDVLQQVGLDRLIDRVKKLLWLRRRDEELERLPQAVRLRKALESLGPTFLKMGQVLSTRPDLIPPEWADEFRKLQSDVPGVGFADVRKFLDAEFNGDVDAVFESIEPEPIAAGSIAQVHRAVLADGSHVVIKVRRPGIDKVIESDLHLLSMLADFVEGHFADLGYSPVAVVEEFSQQLRRELDLTREGRSIDRFNRQFEENEHVRFPNVFWEATTRSVLALEEVEGHVLARTSIDDLPMDDRRALVRHTTDAVFRQCLEIGFFHADPHPGNIVALPGGSVCFLDCGMTGHIDPSTAEALAMLVHGVVSSDVDKVIDVVIELADADPVIAHDRAFRADVWEFVAQFDKVTLGQLPIGPLLRQFFEKVQKHRLRVPADIVYLIKAITTIESVAEQLDPDFDVVEHIAPTMQRLIRQRYGVRALRRRLERSMVGYARFAEDLPDQVRTLMSAVRRNRITINLEHRGLDRLNSEIEHASNNIATGLVVASLIVGSSLFVLTDGLTPPGYGVMSVFAVIGYIAAGVLVMMRAVANRFR